MATVRLKFRPSTVKDRPGSIVCIVTCRRIERQISTGYKVFPEEWDGRRSRVIPFYNERVDIIRSISQRLARDIKRLEDIIIELGNGNSLSSDEVVRLFRETSAGQPFSRFMKELITQLKFSGRYRTSETYATALNSFTRFLEGNSVTLGEIDSDLMEGYEAYLKSHGVTMNTVSFYNRILRAAYNRAVEKGLTPQRSPFRHVYTGVAKTAKRGVPVSVIRRIRDLDLSMDPAMDYARDIFMFSFYTRGMSFVDIAFLKKKDLKNGILSYCRKKTRQHLFVKWEKCMQDIVNKYDTSGTPYLLPVISSVADARVQYCNAAHRINRGLGKIGRLLGLSSPLTTYVARHSWASIAVQRKVPLSAVSEAMGHGSESTTRIYLASLGASAADRANGLVLRSLRGI